jgi:serine/threonine-protein kinase
MAEGQVRSARAPQPADRLVGSLVNGRFQIVRRLASGGMGSVYFATQAPLTRPVALKVLHIVRSAFGESQESFRRRFLLEASILSKLQHPNIVVLYDYGQITSMPGEHYFMAMEYLRGETLARRLRRSGRLGVLESLGLARQIGRGLREAHRSGFIHRDLKPSNIMLVPDDEENDLVKLVDFGIGKVVPAVGEKARDADATQTGLVLGSPRYMSPEQVRSEPVEPRTDVYALGVILFEALTGRVPFAGETTFDIMASHCLQPPPELAELCPEERFPPSLCRLVTSLLQKHAADRPTAEQFLAELPRVEEEAREAPSGSIPPSASILARESLVLRGTRPRLLRPARPRLGADEMETLGSTFARAPAPRKGVVAAAVLSVLALTLGLGRCAPSSAYFRFARGSGESAAARETAPPSAPSDRGASAPAPASSAFVLTLESTPSGATVIEGDAVVGVTPLHLTMDRGPLGASPRTFFLELPGYASATLEQGDSEGPVRQLVTLAPRPRGAPHLASASPAGDSNRGRSDERLGLDIRLRR